MIALTLPVPPSTNALFKNVAGRGRVKTVEYSRWLKHADAAFYCARPKPISGPVEITILCEENNRRDLGNYEKSVTDWLVRCDLIDGDRCKVVRKITLAWHAGPGCSVVVRSCAR